jgi:hypothetical protein
MPSKHGQRVVILAQADGSFGDNLVTVLFVKSGGAGILAQHIKHKIGVSPRCQRRLRFREKGMAVSFAYIAVVEINSRDFAVVGVSE